MKILILTTSNPTINAGIVASDLYHGLTNIDRNNVRIVTKVWDKYIDKNIIPIDSYFDRLWNLSVRIKNNLLNSLLGIDVYSKPKINMNPDYCIQNYDQTITFYKTKKILKRANFIPDAIIVLFMPHFLSYKNLYELNMITKAPIYMYLMDMAPFTGGCHYAWDCKGYLNQCGNCPGFFSNSSHDQSSANWNFKNKYIKKTNISAIAGTEWQYRQLQNSSLFIDKPKHKILLSINDKIFRPGNKETARNTLKLPIHKKIIFFGAVNQGDRRKGIKELVESLIILKSKISDLSQIHLAIAGIGNSELYDNLPFEYTNLGHLNHFQLATTFQAVDVFVSPSLEDSGPMMVNQSIMSGTPVVAFEMGVAVDLVISGKTGYLAKFGDCIDLSLGLEKVLKLTNKESIVYSKNCRQTAIDLFTNNIQAENFMKVVENKYII